jgi:hypothetical protein
MEIRRNASSERAKTVEASILVCCGFRIRLFLADKQHPKGDVLMFQGRHDNCVSIVSEQSGVD